MKPVRWVDSSAREGATRWRRLRPVLLSHGAVKRSPSTCPFASPTIEFQPYTAIVAKCLAWMRRRRVPKWSKFGNLKACGRGLLVARLPPNPIVCLIQAIGPNFDRLRTSIRVG